MKKLALKILFFTFSFAAFSVDKRGKTDVGVEEIKTPERKKATERPKGPRVDSSQAFTFAVEDKLIKNIDVSINYLKKLAAKQSKKSAARLNVMEKLLNLYLEQALYVRNQEFRNYDKRWAEWDENGRKGKEPKLETTRSDKLWKNVISEAKAILAEFPKSQNADVVTFHYAVAQDFVGNQTEAARIYTQLIQEYPNSNTAGDAYFSLGDYYFDRNDYRNALNNYQQALRFKQSERYGWALFKLAWSYYNIGKYQDALKNWKSVINMSRMNPSEQNKRLKDIVLRDMIFGFAETRDVDGAIGYYKSNGGEKYIGDLLMLLSQTFAEQGKYGDAIKTLKRFQKIDPMSPAAPDTQKEILNLASELNNSKMLWFELENFIKLYGPDSTWAKSNEGDRKLVLETWEMIKSQTIYYSKLSHKNAQRTDNQAGYAVAIEGYEMFLKYFPNSKEVPEIKFLMADIEYFRKKYRESGQLYLEIAMLGKDKAIKYDSKTKKSENIHKSSTQFMLDSYLLDFEPELKELVKKKPDFSKPPVPLTLKARNFIKGCDFFVNNYPQDKKNVKNCDIYVSEIFYRSGNKEQAKKYLFVLANKYSSEREGKEAVENLIPMYKNEKKELLALADKFLKIPAYSKGDLGNKLRDLKRGADLESIAQENDTTKRAKLYEDQARKDPKAQDADKLWYNAAVDYLKAGAISEAIVAYMAIYKGYPKSAQYEESLVQLAKLFEKKMDFSSSAQYYQTYYQKFPKSKNAVGALAKTCELNLAANSKNATSSCLSFARVAPDGGKPFIEVLINTAYRSKQTAVMADLIQKNYLRAFKLTPEERIVALYKLYAANGKSNAQTEQEILSAFSGVKGNVSGEALRYVGEIIFRRADKGFPIYSNLKLVGGTVDRLAASIEKKAATLAQLKTNYDQVIATKDSYWGVAAFYQLAMANELFANALENPPSIQGAKTEDVVKQLAPQAKQLRDEAKKIYQTAQDTVTKFRVYNEWAPKILAGLARAENKNLTYIDWVVDPDFLGSQLPTNLAKDLAGDE